MIRPHDLMTLADRLAASHIESEWRAAISRAYYSAYHAARLLIAEDSGVLLAKTADTHQNIYRCLMNGQDASLRAAGSRLESLRGDRNRADYDLDDSTFSHPANVLIQVENAKDVIKQLALAKPNLAVFRPSIREYASKVLKLGLKST